MYNDNNLYNSLVFLYHTLLSVWCFGTCFINQPTSYTCMIPWYCIYVFNNYLWPFFNSFVNVYKRVNLHFPMVFLWFSYGIPMVFPLRPSFSYGFPMGFPLRPSFSYGFPMGFPIKTFIFLWF